MKFAVFNAGGFPVAFYSEEIHGENIPADAVAITDEQWNEFVRNHGRRRWVDGQIEPYEPPALDETDLSNVLFHPRAGIWLDRTDPKFNELVEGVPAVSAFLRDVLADPRKVNEFFELFRSELGAGNA
jgi:hypothetical protein